MLNFRSLSLAVVALALSVSTAYAASSQLQMLPPTFAGSSKTCAADGSVLIYGGLGGTDPLNANQQISAINCLNVPVTINTTTGDLWLGSQNPAGDVWNNIAASEPGPALHFSGNTGWNSDDIYFKRYNDAKNSSELRLVLGDDSQSAYNPPASIGDAFIIGAIDAATWNWVPHFTFTSDGKLGIGTKSPSTMLEVASKIGDYGYIYDNNPQGGFLFGTQGTNSGGGLGVAALSGDWVTDSQPGDVTLRALQGGAINLATSATTGPTSANDSTTKLYITNDGKVGIGTRTPQTALDVNGEVRLSTTNAACDSAHAGMIHFNGTVFEGCDGNVWHPMTAVSLSVNLNTLALYNDLCVAPLVNVTGANSWAGCVSACRRYCSDGCSLSTANCRVGPNTSGLKYGGGTFTEYDGANNIGACTCY